MEIILYLLLVITAAASVQIHYEPQPLQLIPGGFPVPAQASGYIYRSDNDGPASLIQLGAHGYRQPQAFAPPLPLNAQPLLTNIEATHPVINSYQVVEPIAQLPVLAQPIVVAASLEDSDEDDSDEDSDSDSDSDSDEYDSSEEDFIGDDIASDIANGELGQYGHHGHEFEQGGGGGYNDQSHASHGGKGSKGYSSHHSSDKGASGHHDNEGHKGFYAEGAGEKGNSFNEADQHGAHHEAAHGHKGEDYGKKKSHSKGEKTDGFHKVYHKDEYKKNTDFYDESDNSGHFNKHGYHHSRHGSAAGGHKNGGKHNSGHAQNSFGKKGHHSKGHRDAADRGYSAEEGGEDFHDHHEDYAKKGGDSQGKEYGYRH